MSIDNGGGTIEAHIQSGFNDLAERYEDKSAAMTLPIARKLVSLAAVRPRERVLDIATGTGNVALLAAAAMQGEGEVVGIDLSPGMLSVARRKAAAAGHGKVSFRAMRADRLDFPADSFDLVTCSLAIHFFPDPALCLREMSRVLKPGGRLALAFSGPPENNEVRQIVFGVLMPLVGNRLGGWQGPGDTLTLLKEMQFEELQMHTEEDEVGFSTPEEFWGWLNSLGGPAALLGLLSAEEKEAARSAMCQEVARRLEDGGFSVLKRQVVYAVARP